MSYFVLSEIACIIGGLLMGYQWGISRAAAPSEPPVTPEDTAVLDWAQLHVPHLLVARATVSYDAALRLLTRCPALRAALRVELTPRARAAYAARAVPSQETPS